MVDFIKPAKFVNVTFKNISYSDVLALPKNTNIYCFLLSGLLVDCVTADYVSKRMLDTESFSFYVPEGDKTL